MHDLFAALFEGIAQAVFEIVAGLAGERSPQRTRRMAAWGCLLVVALLLGGIALLGVVTTAS